MALSGQAGLQDALKDCYIETESLDGANQYRCSSCNQLVDAKRVRNILKIICMHAVSIINYGSIVGMSSAQIASDFDLCPLEIPV